jgi:alpha-tubulin suppressor-like RCC1 family protein
MNRRSQLRTWTRRVPGALLSLSLLLACNRQDSSPLPPSRAAEARFAIHIDEPLTHTPAATALEVSRLQVDVLEQGQPDTPLLNGIELTATAGDWSGALASLPRGEALTFFARAYHADGSLLFSGSTDQRLTTDSEQVIIGLAASKADAPNPIPRIKRISLPPEIHSGHDGGNISVSVEAAPGERLAWSITADVAPDSGTFLPASGTLTLLGAAGTFVSRYVPPDVAVKTDFMHTVKVTSASGHSVTATFTTKVKPRGPTDGVKETTVTALFNPVIHALDGRRQAITGDVAFTATVTDDTPEDRLTYAWSFEPEGDDAPRPSFSHQTNPTTLRPYTPALRGRLKLAVTDVDGGTTTLEYRLAPNQFPDELVFPYLLSSLHTGASHSCALFAHGAVRCWGDNTSGQLGYGNTLAVGDDEPPYTAGDVPLRGKAVQLALGGHHTCALLDSGWVRCWGDNTSGQLGYGHTHPVGDDEPITSQGFVNLGGSAVKLAAGESHTCALLDTGHVRCWGRNDVGQLGHGHTRSVGDDELPWEAGDVSLGGAVQDLAAGWHHTCALLTDGRVRCWGNGADGALGLGHTRDIGDDELPSSAGFVELGEPVSMLSAGALHTCALLKRGAVRCWGSGLEGQLGHGGTWPVPRASDARDVDLGSPSAIALQVSAGGHHTCALLSTGAVTCWGANAYGQLGQGHRNTLYAPPVASVDLGDATAWRMATGAHHTCVLLSTGGARCWGANASGQLGYGHTRHLGDDEPLTRVGDVPLTRPSP